jgi:hypothetical protein
VTFQGNSEIKSHKTGGKKAKFVMKKKPMGSLKKDIFWG